MLSHKSTPESNIVENASQSRRGSVQEPYILIPGLPNEIATFCMARAPRTTHHNMRGVCQSWRNLLRGRRFWQMRQTEALTEDWLYFYAEGGDIWRAFDPAAEKWLRLPEMPFDNRIPGHSAFASMDGKIFVIGGNFWNFYETNHAYVPCRRVTYFDLKSYCWQRAADLRIARARCMAGVINGELCVFGGYIEGMKDTTITAEAYDPMTNSWRLISSLERPSAMRDSVVTGGKLYAVEKERGSTGVVFDAKTGEWEVMAEGFSSGWNVKTVILDGKFYTVGYEFMAGRIDADGLEPDLDSFLKIYDPSKDDWDVVLESEDWPSVGVMMGILGRSVELVSFAGMLCILSVEEYGWGTHDTVISMVLLEVDNSTETPTCSLKFNKDFGITEDDELEPSALHIKKCHVIAL